MHPIILGAPEITFCRSHGIRPEARAHPIQHWPVFVGNPYVSDLTASQECTRPRAGARRSSSNTTQSCPALTSLPFHSGIPVAPYGDAKESTKPAPPRAGHCHSGPREGPARQGPAAGRRFAPCPRSPTAGPDEPRFISDRSHPANIPRTQQIAGVHSSSSFCLTCSFSSLRFIRIRSGVPSKLMMPVRSRSAALVVVAVQRHHVVPPPPEGSSSSSHEYPAGLAARDDSASPQKPLVRLHVTVGGGRRCPQSC